MNAISLYVSASRLLIQQSDCESANYSDLYRLVPYLRQSLSCTVCANLLVEPYSPEICQHHVCRNCIGGRKNLKPTCTSCKSYHNYHANTQLRILLQCYKSLCNYILDTPSVYSCMHKYVHVDSISNGTNEAQNLAELIDEGAQFHDEYKSNSGLPKSKISILPCIFTSTSSSTQSTSHNQSVSATVGPIITNKPTFSAATVSAKPAQSPNESTAFVRTAATPSICVTSVSSTAPRISLPASKTDAIATMVNNPTITKSTPIKTVSNGTALYSVLYTGAGNKITIKRKTDDNCFSTANTMTTKDVLNMLSRNPGKITQQIKTIAQPVPTPPPHIVQGHTHLKSISGTGTVNVGSTPQTPTTLTTAATATALSSFKKPAFSLKNKALQKRKGCRCGNATPTPGKLTCCGQRCPCYVESKSCVDCKCRGCRNPHRIDGLKVSYGIYGSMRILRISQIYLVLLFQVRPQIPQLTCLVQMNNQSFENNYIDMPMEAFNTSSNSYPSGDQPTIKQEIMPISNVLPGSSRQLMATGMNSQMDMPRSNDTIEYISNDFDDDNIQGIRIKFICLF